MAAQTFGRSARDPATPKVGKGANNGINTGKTNSGAGSERSGYAPPGKSKARKLNS